MDPAQLQHARREKELLERKAYLKNFWYAAGEASQRVAVAAEPGARVMGGGGRDTL